VVPLHHLRPHPPPHQEQRQHGWLLMLQSWSTSHHQVLISTHRTYTSKCAGFCGLALVGISFIMPMLNRGDMRAKYHLRGNTCTDCLCACFCQPCDQSQQDKESAYREQYKLLGEQPGKEFMMNYLPQQQDTAYHHG
jgi:Cys-rich protein (TIGR01571 family)